MCFRLDTDDEDDDGPYARIPLPLQPSVAATSVVAVATATAATATHYKQQRKNEPRVRGSRCIQRAPQNRVQCEVRSQVPRIPGGKSVIWRFPCSVGISLAAVKTGRTALGGYEEALQAAS